MQIRRITKFEVVGDDGAVADVEFVPGEGRTYEVWVDGVFVEEIKAGRITNALVEYYFSVHARRLELELQEDEPETVLTLVEGDLATAS